MRHDPFALFTALALIVIIAFSPGCDVYHWPPDDNGSSDDQKGCNDHDAGPASSDAADSGPDASATPIVDLCPNDCIWPKDTCWGCVNDVCAYAPFPDGTPCDDGDPCTADDACQDGVCVGARAVCRSSSSSSTR